MAHDRAAAVTTTAAAARPMLVARNLIPDVVSSVASSDASGSGSVSVSVSAASSSSTSSSAAAGRAAAARRDRKLAGGERVATATSSSTLSTASSAGGTGTGAAEAARPTRRRHTHHSLHTERAVDKTPQRHRSRSRHRRDVATAATTATASAAGDIGPEKFAAKVFVQSSAAEDPTPVSPPASPEHYSSSSSGGPGSDKDEPPATATTAAAAAEAERPRSQPLKPSRMVVKRRATAPASGGHSRRTASSAAAAAGSPLRTPASGSTSIERMQMRLERARSNSGATLPDGDRVIHNSRRGYSNHRSRQLMESPPPPEPGRLSRRPQPSATTAAAPCVQAPSPAPAPASPNQDKDKDKDKPADSAANTATDAAARPRPVRVRYEAPARGLVGGRREISHASLGKLVARLTDAQQYDTEFRDVFLLTYRGFCTPSELVKKLRKRYLAVRTLGDTLLPDALEETERLLEQLAREEEEEAESDRASTATAASVATTISTARSDIHTSAEASVAVMRLLSVLKFWVKESGFLERDLVDDRRAAKKLRSLLAEIHDTSPIPAIRRHAENLLLTVTQVLAKQAQTPAQPPVPATVPPPPPIVTSVSNSAVPETTMGGGNGGGASPLVVAHQLSDRGDFRSRLRQQAASKLALARSSSDPKRERERERSMVKLRTKAASGDIFQLRSRTADEPLVVRTQSSRKPPPMTTVAPKIARGVTTGSAEAALQARGGAGLDEIIQDTLQRARQTTSTRSSARISYDNVEPLTGLTAQELADQLTLLETEHYFSKLNPRELTNKAWTRESKHRDAPHVLALIELFDATAEWVSSEILHPQLQAVERAKLITLFVDAADNCYRMNNFNTLFELHTGLSAPCIRQLNTTWGLVSAATLEKYQCLQQVCSPDDNYRSYRQAFALAEGQPRLPCWFILVKDLFTFEEAMKSMEDGLVNWHKFRKIYKVISEALERQNFNYVPSSGTSGATTTGATANGGIGASNSGVGPAGVSRKGRGLLRHDRKTQIHIRHRLDTIRKDSSVLYQLARNANTQESILFVNSLSEAGFL